MVWALHNGTPFAAERTWVRDKDGAEVWLVAVRGTFIIQPDGSTTIAPEQDPVCRVPQYLGEPGKSSLLYESDLVHTKATTDILLHGQAYAPQGKPAEQVDVMIKVAGMTKVLRVFGNRRWKEGLGGLSSTAPEPFVTMPITYERAFGGIDQRPTDPGKRRWERRNPIGTGFAIDSQGAAGQLLPNVEDPTDPITSWRQKPHPAGFGPIPRDWSPRIELAGTYDDAWSKQRRPLLPLDFDERFYQCAPTDQQSQRYLRGGEPVELFNLTPNGLLRFQLPRMTVGFLTLAGGERRPHNARLHTVVIEPDQSRVIMIWHTSLACHHDVYTLKWTRIFEKRKVGRDTESSSGVAG